MQANFEKAYSMVWGQYTEALQLVVKGIEEYEEKLEDLDILWLLQELKNITAALEIKSNNWNTLYDAISTLFSMRERNKKSNEIYLESFKANV